MRTRTKRRKQAYGPQGMFVQKWTKSPIPSLARRKRKKALEKASRRANRV